MTHRITCEPHYITHNPLHKGSHATLPITSSFIQQTVTERQPCDQSLAQVLVVSGTKEDSFCPHETYGLRQEETLSSHTNECLTLQQRQVPQRHIRQSVLKEAVVMVGQPYDDAKTP